MYGVGVAFGAIALLIGGVAGVGPALGAFIPGGVLVAAAGILMLRDHRGVLQLLQHRSKGSLLGAQAFPAPSRFGGALMLIVGAGWIALGIVSL